MFMRKRGGAGRGGRRLGEDRKWKKWLKPLGI